ncbi:MAG TPA: hypothetical protein ENF30_01220 [Candidatus Desulfofervidus auxilii]|uniref:Uncharacterized protein n=1 Tax=Desulfofervidus auxilii TaxID=1621989 RepID=A0A7V0I9V0_DESA2|nr:hypothetical protein [Candidatus Desulfofervidus auxilii]
MGEEKPIEKRKYMNWFSTLISIIALIFAVLLTGKVSKIYSTIDNTASIFSGDYDYWWECISWNNKNCSELVPSEMGSKVVFIPRGFVDSECDKHCIVWSLRRQKKGLVEVIKINNSEVEPKIIKENKNNISIEVVKNVNTS